MADAQNEDRYVDPALYEHATDRQKEILDAIEAAQGVQRDAAAALGLAPQTVSDAYLSVKKKAAKQGWTAEPSGAHLSHQIPDGYKLKGRSTYYDRDGNPRGEWVKTDTDRDRQFQIIKEALESMCSSKVPLEALPPPVEVDDKLLNLYTMTDCHMGMLAWEQEAGADWDLKIGERVLTGCFAAMVDRAPAAKTCVVAQLGDFLHYDGLVPMTPTSGHILDADSRAGKMVAIAIDVLIRLVEMALAKHEKVYVLMAEGNHDMYGSIFLRILFSRLFANEPRVEMIHSENPFYAHQFGKTMLCWHHGHKKGLDPSTALMFAERWSDMFGQTKHRYIHFGDKHHWAGKEVPGFYLEQHPTLAAADAYAARGGWDSRQRAEAITYHSEYGQAARFTVTPAMCGL